MKSRASVPMLGLADARLAEGGVALTLDTWARGMQSKAVPRPGLIHVVVESPAGATTKIKHDPELEAFTLSRPLPLGMSYPHDWGFIPGTCAPDRYEDEEIVLF